MESGVIAVGEESVRPAVGPDALACGVEGSDLVPVHVTGTCCGPADGEEEGCG